MLEGPYSLTEQANHSSCQLICTFEPLSWFYRLCSGGAAGGFPSPAPPERDSHPDELRRSVLVTDFAAACASTTQGPLY
jgi:hypothetical protein